MGLVFLVISMIFLLRNCANSEYAPYEVTCPLDSSFLRSGKKISNDEVEWMENRNRVTDAALYEFLNKSGLSDFDIDDFFSKSNQSIKIGLAFSGGGYRAMLVGAGQMAALDNRTESSRGHQLQGILQSASYISALSGGSWLVGSLMGQNWPAVSDVVLEDEYDVWNLTETRQLLNTSDLVFNPLPLLNGDLETLFTSLNNWESSNETGIQYDLLEKAEAGFNTSIVDAWARGLSHQLFPKGTDNYKSSMTMSSIRNSSSFKNYDMPFPIINALGRDPNSIIYDINTTLFEFNPFEMGSFEKSIYAFTKIDYIGTNVTDGIPRNSQCVKGYDNLGFLLGTSSSLFNMFLNTLKCKSCLNFPKFAKGIAGYILNKISSEYEDVAIFRPNPFYHSRFSNSSLVKNESLYMIDGGLAGQVVPLGSLMTVQRPLDIVLAFDTSEKWPNGSSLAETYQRQFLPVGSSQLCPYVPDPVTFLEKNLTTKPTFFGCDASNLTKLEKHGVIPPILVYFANRPLEYLTNTSLYKLSYTDQEKKHMITNGFDIATRANLTIDNDWATCLACAIIRREEERRGEDQTEQCRKCFENYCWDGTTVDMGKEYYRKVNFTMTGLTNDTMDVPILKEDGISS